MPVYKEIGYHIIFDIKMIEIFTRKARLVENCHENEYVPKWDTYSSVVSRDSVRIEFLYAALKNLDIFSCDISNTYLEAPCVEKLLTMAGKEFGSLDGTSTRINQALYGIKYAGNSWHKSLSTTSSDMNFEPSRADADIWIILSTSLRGENYWEWILLYIDNLLSISERMKAIIDSHSIYLTCIVIPLS